MLHFLYVWSDVYDIYYGIMPITYCIEQKDMKHVNFTDI